MYLMRRKGELDLSWMIRCLMKHLEQLKKIYRAVGKTVALQKLKPESQSGLQ